jgi:hypothetical protein
MASTAIRDRRRTLRYGFYFCCREGELNPQSAKHRRILRERIQLRWGALNYAAVRPARVTGIFNYAQLRSSRPECARLPSQGRHKQKHSPMGQAGAATGSVSSAALKPVLQTYLQREYVVRLRKDYRCRMDTKTR